MIYGIGVDTTTVARVKKSCENAHFCTRVFGPSERALLALRTAESAAANFAAKEAFLKAAGTGLSGGIALCEVEVLRRESGAPYFVCTGAAASFLQQNALRAHLSLTHEGGFAHAFVILEKEQ